MDRKKCWQEGKKGGSMGGRSGLAELGTADRILTNPIYTDIVKAW